MNKIIINRDIVCNSENVIIKDNKITFNKDGLYEIEYKSNGEYEIEFMINNNITILEYSFDNNITIHNHYIVNKGNLNIYKFYNNHNVLETDDIDLCNEMASVNYKSSSICREEEKYIVNINHLCKNTKSDIVNKAVALKNSKIKYIVNSNVIKEAIKSVLNQTSRIVTMGECETEIEPNMYIDLDDVEAKHGSIIGTFKEEDIFYLMSKGISYNDTIKLLVKGYLLSNMIDNHEIRKKIIDIIDSYWR